MMTVFNPEGDVQTEEGFQYVSPEWYMEVQSGRKALDPDSMEVINEKYNGAETVYVKVMISTL